MSYESEPSPTVGQYAGSDFAHSPYVPFYGEEHFYTPGGRPWMTPYEYTGWRDEQLSWKKTAYINGTLNPSPAFRFKGPDAEAFLSHYITNSFAKFPVGSGKHSIQCDEQGRVISHGVLLREAEDEFVAYYMFTLPFYLEKGNWDVVCEDLTADLYLFQVAGPRSLEVLQRATGDDLRDIEFMRFRKTTIAGREIEILRMGMAGSLAYELHGDVRDAHAIYDSIYQAGKPLGIRRLGYRTYMMNHTENGFPQMYYHFPMPADEIAGFVFQFPPFQYTGSMGTDPTRLYRNPIELGWGGMVKFDHDFVGREALEREKAAPRRKIVTLTWNKEDIVDIHRSQLEPGEPYRPIDEPNHPSVEHGQFTLNSDQVLKDGALVGISSGRSYSVYYSEMISLCSIDTSLAHIGTEVVVIWGNPGTRQREVRATVSRFPFYDEIRNQTVDVNAVEVHTPAITV